MNLPTDIYDNICSFLKLSLVIKLPYLNKKFINNFKKKRTFILDKFPNKIISIFGMENMINYPILEFKNKFIGYTDYIDSIRPDDLSEPIMIGVDCFKRAFVSIRTVIINENRDPVVDTLFQRYTNEKEKWTYGCSGYGFIRNDSLDNITITNIKNLINKNKNILYPSYCYEDEDSRYLIRETILI
jgi:hypothetical protein